MWRSLFHCDNAYYLPAVEAVGRVCRTHKTSQTAFRGFGGPQAHGGDRRDPVAGRAALAIPADVDSRAQFLSRRADDTHYGQPVDDADRLARIWTAAEGERAASIAAAPRSRRFNAPHDDVKRGLAITPVKFGISFTATFYNQAGALVLVYRDGSVQVNHGGTEMGQGLFTKIHQIAADALGVIAERMSG